MRTSPYERGFPHGDVLNSEARAVIEAEFEDITTDNPPLSFRQLMKDVFQWIKQRLHRAR